MRRRTVVLLGTIAGASALAATLGLRARRSWSPSPAIGAAVPQLRPPPGVTAEDYARLDGQGRMMLDPLREGGLRPGALVARIGLAPDAVVADVGAGPGFLSLPFARAVPAGKVIATDVNPTYLEVAATRARAAGLTNLETRVTPPDRPDLGPGSVDLALLCQVDQALPDRVGYFRALALALKPGGRIAVVNYTRRRAAALQEALAAGLVVVDEWYPSPPFFLIVFAPRGAR